MIRKRTCASRKPTCLRRVSTLSSFRGRNRYVSEFNLVEKAGSRRNFVQNKCHRARCAKSRRSFYVRLEWVREKAAREQRGGANGNNGLRQGHGKEPPHLAEPGRRARADAVGVHGIPAGRRPPATRLAGATMPLAGAANPMILWPNGVKFVRQRRAANGHARLNE